jgi:hypothetical protein
MAKSLNRPQGGLATTSRKLAGAGGSGSEPCFQYPGNLQDAPVGRTCGSPWFASLATVDSNKADTAPEQPDAEDDGATLPGYGPARTPAPGSTPIAWRAAS